MLRFFASFSRVKLEVPDKKRELANYCSDLISSRRRFFSNRATVAEDSPSLELMKRLRNTLGSILADSLRELDASFFRADLGRGEANEEPGDVVEDRDREADPTVDQVRRIAGRKDGHECTDLARTIF